jgi:hypothetical protein
MTGFLSELSIVIVATGAIKFSLTEESDHNGVK